MRELLLVACGGAIGAVARWRLSAWVLQLGGDGRFPAGTLAVNVLGCALAGLVAGLAQRHAFLTPEVRLLLFTGLLGGFTTFSAFGLETVQLLRRGEATLAAAYVLASVAAGVLALWLGMAAGAARP